MQQQNEKILKIFVSPVEFGTWLRENRQAQQMSLREMATRCGYSTLVEGTVSASYINRLEHGIDAVVAPEILVMFKDVLDISYSELLEHLSERNYVRFSRYLKDRRVTRIIELGSEEKEQEWYAFLERTTAISRKIIEPLLWDLAARDIIGVELIPYTWEEDFWAGISQIEDMGECMANLADIFDILVKSNDRVASAAKAAIEAALGSDYIEERRKRRLQFEKRLEKEIEERKLYKKKVHKKNNR